MINVVDKYECCGCGACVRRCPNHCLTLHEDDEGFLYPYADSDACTNCGLCKLVCPIANPDQAQEPLKVLAAVNKDENIRLRSSSGGIFTILAESVIREGGVVFGARFDEDWQVIMDFTETIEGLASFRGSKYVQARTEDTYPQCEKFLENGRKVLYSGTPCQIAGLHHYLRRDYDNLVTCDLACHGVPSPKVWRMYLNELVDESNRTVSDAGSCGNNETRLNSGFNILYDADNEVATLSCISMENPYNRAFLGNLILRPSCHKCQVKEGRSKSDITLADYWGIGEKHPDMDDDKGVGLVVIHSEKGASLLDLSRVNYIETEYAEAVCHNTCLFRPTTAHRNRTAFFEQIDMTDNVGALMKSCLKLTLKQRIVGLIKSPRRVIMKTMKSVLHRKRMDKCYKRKQDIDIHAVKESHSVRSISFRDKSGGWKSYRIVIELQ